MHFRILKMIATSGLLTALECTKFDFAGAPLRTPLGELTDPLAGLRGPLLRGRDGKGEEGWEELGEGQRTGQWKRRGMDAREKGGKWRGREEQEEGKEG